MRTAPENVEAATKANEKIIEAFRNPEKISPGEVLEVVKEYDGNHRVFAHIRHNAAKYFFERATKVEQDKQQKQKLLRQARQLISGAILKYKYNPEEFKNHRAAAHFWEAKILWEQGEEELAREAVGESLEIWEKLAQEDPEKWDQHYQNTKAWAVVIKT